MVWARAGASEQASHRGSSGVVAGPGLGRARGGFWFGRAVMAKRRSGGKAAPWLSFLVWRGFWGYNCHIKVRGSSFARPEATVDALALALVVLPLRSPRGLRLRSGPPSPSRAPPRRRRVRSGLRAMPRPKPLIKAEQSPPRPTRTDSVWARPIGSRKGPDETSPWRRSPPSDIHVRDRDGNRHCRVGPPQERPH